MAAIKSLTSEVSFYPPPSSPLIALEPACSHPHVLGFIFRYPLPFLSISVFPSSCTWHITYTFQSQYPALAPHFSLLHLTFSSFFPIALFKSQLPYMKQSSHCQPDAIRFLTLGCYEVRLAYHPFFPSKQQSPLESVYLKHRSPFSIFTDKNSFLIFHCKQVTISFLYCPIYQRIYNSSPLKIIFLLTI